MSSVTQSQQPLKGKIRERLKEIRRKYGPEAEAAAKKAVKAGGSIALELLKHTKAGKRIGKKLKKTRKGFHKECRLVKD